MTASSKALVDSLCRFFGGPYAPATLDYRTPTVTGLGSVRRGLLSHQDPTYFYTTIPTGHWSLLVVSLSRWDEERQTMGVGTGLKRRRNRVELGLFTRSVEANPSLAFDDVLVLVDALVTRIESDPDCGTGGWERGGVSFGEGSPSGLSVDYAQPPPSGKTAYTLQRVVISGVVTQYVTA